LAGLFLYLPPGFCQAARCARSHGQIPLPLARQIAKSPDRQIALAASRYVPVSMGIANYQLGGNS